MLEILNQLDTQIFLYLNSFHNDFWDTVMWYISGKYTWIPLYLLILFFVFKQGKKQGILVFLFLILTIVVADQSSVNLFKNVFERLRPCHQPAIKDLVHIVNNKCGGQFGFVSSHATNTFAFATFIAYFFKKKTVFYSLFFWAFLVSYSRIYLGVHYFGDVIGGIILGYFIGYILYKIYLKFAFLKIAK